MSDLIELKLVTREDAKWISPILIIPKFQNKGIASKVIG